MTPTPRSVKNNDTPTSSADLRDSALYARAHAVFSQVWNPGSGRPTNASDIAVAPDGRHVAFSGTLLATLEAAPMTRICLASTSTGDLRTVSLSPHLDLSPKFSPDGRYLAFRSDRARSGDFQVYLLDLESGETRAAPAVCAGWVEALEYSPDGTRLLLLVAAHGADLAGAQGAKTSQRIGAEMAPRWLPSVATRDQSTGRRSAWVVNLAAHSVARVSPTDLNIWETAWCGPKGIAAIVSEGSSEDDWYRAQVAHIDLGSREVSIIHEPLDQLGGLSGSPDGQYVAVVEAVCSDRYLCAGALLVLDSSGAGTRRIDTRHVDVTSVAWRDNTHLLISGIRNLETVVAEVDVVSGSVAEQWRSEELYSQSPFYPQAIPCGLKGFAMVIQGFRQAPRVVQAQAGQLRTIVDLSHAGADAVAGHLRPVEPYRWTAPDGQKIEGWLMRGAGSKAAPLIMEVHGGPIWRWSPFFLGRSAYHFMLAELGCAFFWPNPRGSSGRGQQFARSPIGDIGGIDARDLLAGIDALVAAGIADAQQLGIMGTSYGGFMAAWLITQDPRFSAAIAVSPITNWVSHDLTCNVPYFDAYSLAGDYSDQGSHYFTRSPITFAQRAKTPTLNICGALDRCTPPSQAAEFHNALLRHGTESALVNYPTEGHGVRGFPAVIDYAARIVDWFTRHFAGAR